MKIAAVGLVAIVAGVGAGVAGLVAAGAVWIAGGLLTKALLSDVDLRAANGADPGWSDLYGGRRGVATVVAVITGVTSIAIGVAPIGFETDDGLRWIPVAIGALIVGLQLVVVTMFALGSGLHAAADAIGVPDHPAAITVHSFTETGMRINDRPRIAFELTVRPDGREPYDTTAKMVISFTDLGSMQRGLTYRGLVDLDKPNAVSIDWHDPLDQHTSGDAAETDGDPRHRLVRVDELLRDGLITSEEHSAARRDILGDL